MPTPYFNLPLYTVSDTAALDTLLNGQSSALDTALLGNIWKFSGTTANITSITAPRLRAGIEYFATDTGVLWKYDGSNWVTNVPGSYLITPTSVTGGTVSGGVIAVSAGTTVQINGVFTSRFRSYKVVYDFIFGAAGGTIINFSAAGTTSGASYASQHVYWASNGTPASAYSASAPNIYNSTYSDTRQAGELTLIGPALAAPTAYQGRSTATGGTVGAWDFSGLHTVSSAFDGFRFTTVGGSFTGGSISIYGLA